MAQCKKISIKWRIFSQSGHTDFHWKCGHFQRKSHFVESLLSLGPGYWQNGGYNTFPNYVCKGFFVPKLQTSEVSFFRIKSKQALRPLKYWTLKLSGLGE
jgi:hypothetical protein